MITRRQRRARSRAWASYAVSGLLLGASLYTYMASRGMPLLFVICLLALAITDRVRLRRVWRGTVVVLLTAAIVARRSSSTCAPTRT